MPFIPTQRRIGSAPNTYKNKVSAFFGLDKSQDSDKMTLSRAYDIDNMIRTGVGKVDKRKGFIGVEHLANSKCYVLEETEQEGGIISTELSETYFGYDILSDFSIEEIKIFQEKEKQIEILITKSNGAYFVFGKNIATNYEKEFESGNIDLETKDYIRFKEVPVLYYKPLIYEDKTKNHIYLIDYNAIYMIDYSGDGIIRKQISNFSVNGPLWQTDEIYIPKIRIGSDKNGAGGTMLESFNLLSIYAKESFEIKSTDFVNKKLTFKPLKEAVKDYTKVFYLNKNDEWTEINNITNNITINAENKTITIDSQDDMQFIDGEDNLYIVFKRDEEKFFEDIQKINNCKCVEYFGLEGYEDRVFLSGNDLYKNYVFYSEMDKPLYFPELNYLKVGINDNEIYSMAKMNKFLSVTTNNSIFLITGRLTENQSEAVKDYDTNYQFYVCDNFSIAEPVKDCPCVSFMDEILYLAKSGIHAIRQSTMNDSRYAVNVSAFINKELIKDIENGYSFKAVSYNDFCYFIASKNNECKAYILDGMNYTQSAANPYSNKQYECYYFSSVPGDKVFTVKNSGSILKKGIYFYKNKAITTIKENEANAYTDKLFNDNGETESYPIKSFWETPDIYGIDFYKDKTFSKIGLMIDYTKEMTTAVKIEYRVNNGEWKMLKDYDGTFYIFNFKNINFQTFSFRTELKKIALSKKIKIKKAQSVRFRFSNDIINMPMGLSEFGIDYVQN